MTKGNEKRKKVNFLPRKNILKNITKNFFKQLKIDKIPLLRPSSKNNGDSEENQEEINRCFSRKNIFYKDIIEKINVQKNTQEGDGFRKTFLKGLDILILVQNTWRLPQMRSGQNCLCTSNFFGNFCK